MKKIFSTCRLRPFSIPRIPDESISIFGLGRGARGRFADHQAGLKLILLSGRMVFLARLHQGIGGQVADVFAVDIDRGERGEPLPQS